MDRREFLAARATLAGGCTGCVRGPTASLSMTAVTDTEPRLSANEQFVHDDSVYRVAHEVVASEPATSFQFTFPAEGNVEESETIRYEQLPDVDRAKLDLGADPFLGFGSSLLYLDDEIPESMLVPEPEYPVIVWDADTRGRFEVDGSYDTALKTFRYTAERIESATAYGRRLREEYGFELAGLSDGERSIVEQAIDGGYVVPVEESPPEELQALAERFRPRRASGARPTTRPPSPARTSSGTRGRCTGRGCTSTRMRSRTRRTRAKLPSTPT